MSEQNLNSGQTSTDSDNGGWSITKIAIIASIVFVAIILIPFIIGIVISIADIENGMEIIQLVRDIFIIVLSMVSVTIALAIAVLVVQVAGLLNLLQHEIKPILQDLQATLTSARGTVKFVGDNVAQPIVKAGGFMAGLSVFIREVGGIRRAIGKSKES